MPNDTPQPTLIKPVPLVMPDEKQGVGGFLKGFLVLFFVLLLAFAEVIGFTPAYVVAAIAIAGLNTAYSAAVLKSWRRAGVIGAILVALYAVLYVLLSLDAYALLIGSILLFAALAGTMYVTRRLDWTGIQQGNREQAGVEEQA